jgi:hypothetical protein
MGVLTQWLGPERWTTLKHEHLGKQPFALPSVAVDATKDFGWSVLDEALASAEADVIVVQRGQRLQCPSPRSLAEVRSLFGDGAGIALRRADHASGCIKELAAGVSRDMPGEQRVIVFATPGETHGFGWHFDAEEVFILQTEGAKTYYLRANTVLPGTAEPSDAAFAAYAAETSPLLACELHAGDFLYVPSHWWHAAIAHSASLSVSIGIRPSPQHS